MDMTKILASTNKIVMNAIKESTLYTHNKTGKIYILLNDDLIECTNGREEKKYCLYANQEGKIFVREHDEFYSKFTEL